MRERKKRNVALRKRYKGVVKCDLDVPLTFVFMFLATKDRGMRYGTGSERVTKHRRAKTYPEGRGPRDGPTDIVRGSDTDGMDSREHYENRRA